MKVKEASTVGLISIVHIPFWVRGGRGEVVVFVCGLIS